MVVDKACSVVLRNRETIEILAFVHPMAGVQLVKGSVEPGESTEVAAVRELLEEAGIRGKAGRYLGLLRSITGQTWAFHQCHVMQELPDTWVHFAEDDGGHAFEFFWHPLDSEPSGAWHQIYQEALGFLKRSLAQAPQDSSYPID
ncbi:MULTISPECIES: NUDIX hydrolase [Pseudomonas syringae group]|uniref:NUDIX hydrolase n=1 Tax=Pseudomonas syringae group TaxID=136849 RepID=UPI0006D5E495|nr:NUDIX domain-containing protein [Pseudomonas coronafaciens]RMS89853.1 MutT/nudix protein [Pseudomonas coronafaciens pv. oryzae]RMS90629.1 MutT/nudix protein [Pseudomonas coronafaciens pv. oryzae]RMV83673.1 MutT/nudix protein [Pseudomonas coronafaciens pv. garcae]